MPDCLAAAAAVLVNGGLLTHSRSVWLLHSVDIMQASTGGVGM